MSYNEKKQENDISENKLEKILYSIHDNVCFACGEKIKKKTIVCPYCKTKIKLG
ncbi:MAG: hypothetical protein ACFE8L_07460 [Candidatus Hodarchaeota archaeon]